MNHYDRPFIAHPFLKILRVTKKEYDDNASLIFKSSCGAFQDRLLALCIKAIDKKMDELFGPDIFAYLDECAQQKKSMDPQKIIELREYISNLLEVWNLTRITYWRA